MTIDPSTIDAIANLAEEAATPDRLEPGNLYVVRTRDGLVREFDLTGDTYRDTPRRKTGTTQVRDAASFLAYWSKHSDADSEIYADRKAGTITGVLDAHTATGARFGEHRITPTKPPNSTH